MLFVVTIIFSGLCIARWAPGLCTRGQAYKSFLSMPPVNLKLGVKMAADEVMLDSHSTLELIRLEASAVKACLIEVVQPETLW